MGVATDIMQTFAAREIRSHFPESEGWEYRQEPSPVPDSMVFILSREVRGRKEVIPLAVCYEEMPSLFPLEYLTSTMNGKKLTGKYLLVPKGAEVTSLPGDIRVLFMDSFGFVDERLVWLTRKKNAKQYPKPEAPVTAGSATPASEPHMA